MPQPFNILHDSSVINREIKYNKCMLSGVLPELWGNVRSRHFICIDGKIYNGGKAMKQKTIAGKLTALCAAVVLAATSAGAAFSAYASEGIELPRIPIETTTLPKRFDLRNVNGKNYVTPVKAQQPFSTCWAFATASIAETAYLYANDLGVPAGQVNDRVDLSEKYLAYYAFQPITKDDVSGTRIPASQVGDGVYVSDNAAEVLDKQGKQSTGVEMLARFGGGVDERTKVDGETPYAYIGKNKWEANDPAPSEAQMTAMKPYLLSAFLQYASTVSTQSEKELTEQFNALWDDPKQRPELLAQLNTSGNNNSYAAYDDWSIPVNAKYRLVPKVADVKQYKMFDAINENSETMQPEYKFSQSRLDAVKEEIVSGHAMMTIVAGDDLGNQDTDGKKTYINKTTWAQYVNDSTEADHAVTVVGYDDNYAKENFAIKGADGKDDPDTIPPANGAFIVKNSWGYVSAEDEATAKDDGNGNKIYSRPGAFDFGVDKSGYYYVSYYDHSIDGFVSIDLYKNSEKHAENANQYDLMTSDSVLPYLSADKDDKNASAAVFTSQQDETLEEISVYAPAESTAVKYSIYKDPKGNDPTTGELLTSGSRQFRRPGYYRFALNKKCDLKKGDKYAVVLEMTGYYGENKEKKMYCVAPVPTSVCGGKGVINKGENLLCEKGTWSDYSTVLDKIKANIYSTFENTLPKEAIENALPNGKDSITVDNLAIRAYTTPAASDIRFAGSNRFETAAKISQESGLFEYADTVVIANGMNYADALAGVPLAAKLNAPILLTNTDALPDETIAEIDRLKVKNAVILGGTGAVSESAEKALKGKGITTKRVFGQSRFSTAAEIAKELNAEPQELFLVYGLDFADALSASTAAAVKGAPIIYLTKDGEMNADTKAYLGSVKGKVKNAYVIGGEGVISDSMMNSTVSALGIEKAERLSGKNRYLTCLEVNKKFADVLTGSMVCAATGADFPDALAGGVYAALNKAPLLLVNGKESLSAEQKAFLAEKKANSTAVFGGTGVVPEELAKSISESAK